MWFFIDFFKKFLKNLIFDWFFKEILKIFDFWLVF